VGFRYFIAIIIKLHAIILSMDLLPLVALDATENNLYPAQKRQFLISLSGDFKSEKEHYVIDWFDSREMKRGSKEFNTLKEVADFMETQFDFFSDILKLKIEESEKKKKSKKELVKGKKKSTETTGIS